MVGLTASGLGGTGRRQIVRRALRGLSWRRPARRAGAGAAAGKSRTSDGTARRCGHRGWPRRDADARLRREAGQGRDRGAGRPIFRRRCADTLVGQRGDRREPRHPCRRAGARPAALRGRSAEPVRRGRDRRPPRDDPRWRSLRAVGAVSDPLRAAWRAEVHARRALRLLHVARRLGQQVRSLDPDHAVRGARRHQFAQYRDFPRRQAYRRRELLCRTPS